MVVLGEQDTQQWGFRQCLPFSWTTRGSKHCRHSIAVMGVVDTFRQSQRVAKVLLTNLYTV